MDWYDILDPRLIAILRGNYVVTLDPKGGIADINSRLDDKEVQRLQELGCRIIKVSKEA